MLPPPSPLSPSGSFRHHCRRCRSHAAAAIVRSPWSLPSLRRRRRRSRHSPPLPLSCSRHRRHHHVVAAAAAVRQSPPPHSSHNRRRCHRYHRCHLVQSPPLPPLRSLHCSCHRAVSTAFSAAQSQLTPSRSHHHRRHCTVTTAPVAQSPPPPLPSCSCRRSHRCAVTATATAAAIMQSPPAADAVIVDTAIAVSATNTIIAFVTAVRTHDVHPCSAFARIASQRDIPTSYLIGAPTTFYGALKKHNGFLRTWTVIYSNTAGILQEYCHRNRITVRQ